jgi:phosphate ABC transporter phosphate-binding protein
MPSRSQRKWQASFLAILGLAGLCCRCGRGSGAAALNGGGSSFVFPLMSKWTSDYSKLKGVKVDYQSIGSPGGIQQMTAKKFDFGCIDFPLKEKQLKEARQTAGSVVHLPLVIGAVVPIYNLQGVKEALKFTGPVLARIYLGQKYPGKEEDKILRWNHPDLKKLNPGVDLPDKDIVVVHRSDGSGTTYTWTDYLGKVSAAWQEKVGVGTSIDWPTGVGVKG